MSQQSIFQPCWEASSQVGGGGGGGGGWGTLIFSYIRRLGSFFGDQACMSLHLSKYHVGNHMSWLDLLLSFEFIFSSGGHYD